MRTDLGLVRTMREFPAMRPAGTRGYIDLLGVGKDGALHVVETKIGADPMLVLQGLDYWIWTMAHRAELAKHLSSQLEVPLTITPEVVLDFVVAEAQGMFVSPYTAAQVEALDGAINWQFHTVEHWDRETTEVTPLGRRRSPGGRRAHEARYATRLEADLIERAGSKLHRRVFFAESGAGIAAAAQPALIGLRDRGVLHGFVDHVRSSQAFALNLFGGLDEEELRGVWAIIAPAVTDVGGIEFEYVDSADALSELQPSRPHQTQVDVLLRGSTAEGTTCIALIEVKLSETRFGSCSAFESASNDRRDVCRSIGPWGGDRAGCFQLRNHAGPMRRRYDDYLDPPQVEWAEPECPFRALNQPMRNVALAQALIDRGEADSAAFCLCAPRASLDMWRQWWRAERLFSALPALRLRALPAERVLAAVGVQRRQEITARYGFVAEAG